jgi:hypothetical protein
MHTVVERAGSLAQQLIEPFIAKLFALPEFEVELPSDDLLSDRQY